jgi:hypothetical protein
MPGSVRMKNKSRQVKKIEKGGEGVLFHIGQRIYLNRE